MPYSPPQTVGTLSLLASAARTATNSTSFVRPPRHIRGVRVFVEVTAATSSPSVTFKIETKNDLDTTYHALLTSAAVTGISSNFYDVGVGVTAVANLAAGKHIGNGFRVTATHGNSDSITYKIRYQWLP